MDSQGDMKTKPNIHTTPSSSAPLRPNYKPYKDPYIDHQDPTPTYPISFPVREVDVWFHAARMLSLGLLSSGWLVVGIVGLGEVGGSGSKSGWFRGSLKWLGRAYAIAEVGFSLLEIICGVD